MSLVKDGVPLTNYPPQPIEVSDGGGGPHTHAGSLIGIYEDETDYSITLPAQFDANRPLITVVGGGDQIGGGQVLRHGGVKVCFTFRRELN